MPDSGSNGAATSETGRSDRSPQPVRSATNLTTGQFLMWMGQKLHPDAPLYNMVHAFEITGPLEPGHFERAFQALLDRSDALRIVVDDEGGIPRQRFVAPYRHSIDRVDLSDTPDPDGALDDWVAARSAAPLDLRESAFDTALIALAPDRHVWYLNQHHIITDIWSTALIYRRVSEYYLLSQSGLLENTPFLPSFEEYVAYEAAYTSSGQAESVAGYWQKQRENLADTCQLYGRRGDGLSTRTERVRHNLGSDRSAKLRAIGQEPGIRALTTHLSHFSIFAALVLAYMRRVGGQQELTLGTPSHNRPTAAFKETIGLFIEVFPFSVTLAEDETFRSLIRKVQREALTFFRNAQPGTSSAAANRGYNVLLNYLPVSFSSEFAGLPMTSTWVHSGHGDSRHHLRIQAHDLDNTGAFQLYFDFNADLFDSRQQLEAVDHFVHLLDAALGDLDQLIIAPSLLDEQTQHLLLEMGRSAPDSPSDPPTVLEMIEAQTEKTPQASAVSSEGCVLTYSELDEWSNQLARYLQEHGVGPDVRVGLCVRRSPAAIAAVLAVLKAGGAYVPMDPGYPAARLTSIIEDAGIRILLTNTALASNFDEAGLQPVCIDADVPPGGSMSAGRMDITGPRETQPAYVIYTSGSTGKPKGVVVGHSALADYVAWAREFYLGGQPNDFPLFTPLAVDLTVTSLFVPLTTGGCIVVYGEDENPAALVSRVVTDNAVDVIKMTPSHYALVRHLNIPDSRVRMLILGGEDLKSGSARDMLRTFGTAVTVYNEYGPTEVTVGCMIYRFDPARDVRESVPIGRASARSRVYVLDEALHLVPLGVAGELYISGPQVADGYLNEPDLTRARFLPDPFNPTNRMYRTGDRVRWGGDNILEYLGRTDDQIKIRGARVELGEVESILCQHASITTGAVTVTSLAQVEEEVKHCVRCGLPSNYPEASFDSHGACHLCTAFDRYEERARQYFRSMHQLETVFKESRRRRPKSPYDCLVLLSGGKDSTYALARLVDMGLRVLSFTLDNGYIAEGAKDNIRRVTAALGVDHIFGETPAMNAIFVDSLQRFSNVCNGCFKTIYTLALQEARTRSIPIIVTGLSRGQFFETRLTESLFLDDEIDAEMIDDIVLEARKSYHKVDDAVARLLDVAALQDDSLFDQIHFVDFYRYCDVSLEEMLDYLDRRLPWVRPSDTGRSTNCLINNVGIYVHKTERGFHNYAFPYSWDVRVGHKTRKETLEELDDEIDETDVNRILREIGYEVDAVQDRRDEYRLAAYYVSDTPLPTSELRSFISDRLPEYMVPSYFVHLDALPLNPTGKVDRRALPDPHSERPELRTPYAKPRTETENNLARLWADALHVHEVGVLDNFFDLGGDSITAIQIVARANREGIHISPAQLFRGQTIEALASTLTDQEEIIAEQGAVVGPIALTPVQHRFFELSLENPHHWNQVVWLTADRIEVAMFSAALDALVTHHDALRFRFEHRDGRWNQSALAAGESLVELDVFDLSEHDSVDARRREAEIAIRLSERLDLENGPIFAGAICRRPDADRIVLIAHHLVVDSISWTILVEDLNTALRQVAAGSDVSLPRKTSSFRTWSQFLLESARTDEVTRTAAFWCEMAAPPAQSWLPDKPPHRMTEGSSNVVAVTYTPEETQILLGDVRARLEAEIDEILLAVLSGAVIRVTGASSAQLDVEGHGRGGLAGRVRVARTVGWFTSVYPLNVRVGPDEHPGTWIATVRHLRRRVPHDGLSYGLLRYLRAGGPGEPPVPASGADILFNYLGRFTTADTHDWIRFDGELSVSKAPNNRRAYPLEVNAWVVDHALCVEFSSATDMVPVDLVSTITAEFDQHLRELLKQSGRSKIFKEGEPPVEFGMSSSQLERIASLLKAADTDQNS